MPQLNRKGPKGEGSGTGKGLGLCQRHNRKGMGLGVTIQNTSSDYLQVNVPKLHKGGCCKHEKSE